MSYEFAANSLILADAVANTRGSPMFYVVY